MSVHLLSLAAPRPQALWAAVVFNSGAPKWDYSIRMNNTAVPPTDFPIDGLQRGQDDGFQHQYFTADGPKKHDSSLPGFVPIQLSVDKFILNRVASNVTSQVRAAVIARTRACLCACVCASWYVARDCAHVTH